MVTLSIHRMELLPSATINTLNFQGYVEGHSSYQGLNATVYSLQEHLYSICIM